MRRLALVFATASVVASAVPARADYPYCRCARQGELVICRAGFSDGETAEGAALELIADDGTTLQRLIFGKNSTLSFRPPAQGYYVLFDAGPGLTVEVEPRDIR